MYKTYAKFMKHWAPTNIRCTSISYPSVWITYSTKKERLVELVKGGIEENKKYIQKFIAKVSNKQKELFFLKIILLKERGVEEKIHESGKYSNLRKWR